MWLFPIGLQIDTLITVASVPAATFKECFTKVQALVNDFTEKYPDLHNLEKYC